MTCPRISATPVESAPRLGAAPRFWATTRATRRADPVRVDRPPWPGIGPGSVAPNCRGADGGCRSRQSDTYRIESREVRYPWHPWYGRAVWIDQAVVRGGLAVFRCRLELGQAQRSVEVPQWMFDAASCHRMRLGPIPSVRWEVLRDLQALLSSRTQLAERDDLRDAQHRAEHGRGGADATITEQSACPSAVPVSPDVAVAAMGDLPARDPRADRALAGSTPAQAPGWGRRRRSRPGGGR